MTSQSRSGFGESLWCNKTTTSGECEPARFQLQSDAIVDAWYCKLAVVERTAEGAFVASANIDFAVKKATWKSYAELLRCR